MHLTERRLVSTAERSWVPTENAGHAVKLLSSDESQSTTLLKLAPGARLFSPPVGWGREIFLLEGGLESDRGKLPAGGYVRFPASNSLPLTTESGCVLFMKSGAHDPRHDAVIHFSSRDLPWQEGQGNLRVKSLHSFEGAGTALVHWPAGERFVPHKHWGGEEVFVLSGKFEDEHGEYPAGTWIQSPHLSAHHPFVESETVILVKTGHLLPQ